MKEYIGKKASYIAPGGKKIEGTITKIGSCGNITLATLDNGMTINIELYKIEEENGTDEQEHSI